MWSKLCCKYKETFHEKIVLSFTLRFCSWGNSRQKKSTKSLESSERLTARRNRLLSRAETVFVQLLSCVIPLLGASEFRHAPELCCNMPKGDRVFAEDAYSSLKPFDTCCLNGLCKSSGSMSCFTRYAVFKNISLETR